MAIEVESIMEYDLRNQTVIVDGLPFTEISLLRDELEEGLAENDDVILAAIYKQKGYEITFGKKSTATHFVSKGITVKGTMYTVLPLGLNSLYVVLHEVPLYLKESDLTKELQKLGCEVREFVRCKKDGVTTGEVRVRVVLSYNVLHLPPNIIFWYNGRYESINLTHEIEDRPRTERLFELNSSGSGFFSSNDQNLPNDKPREDNLWLQEVSTSSPPSSLLSSSIFTEYQSVVQLIHQELLWIQSIEETSEESRLKISEELKKILKNIQRKFKDYAQRQQEEKLKRNLHEMKKSLTTTTERLADYLGEAKKKIEILQLIVGEIDEDHNCYPTQRLRPLDLILLGIYLNEMEQSITKAVKKLQHRVNEARDNIETLQNFNEENTETLDYYIEQNLKASELTLIKQDLNKMQDSFTSTLGKLKEELEEAKEDIKLLHGITEKKDKNLADEDLSRTNIHRKLNSRSKENPWELNLESEVSNLNFKKQDFNEMQDSLTATPGNSEKDLELLLLEDFKSNLFPKVWDKTPSPLTSEWKIKEEDLQEAKEDFELLHDVTETQEENLSDEDITWDNLELKLESRLHESRLWDYDFRLDHLIRSSPSVSPEMPRKTISSRQAQLSM